MKCKSHRKIRVVNLYVYLKQYLMRVCDIDLTFQFVSFKYEALICKGASCHEFHCFFFLKRYYISSLNWVPY